MESIYDIMKDRLQVTEPTFLVTILSGPRQGDRTIYNQDGDILYGDAIEGFTLNRVLNLLKRIHLYLSLGQAM